MVVNLFPTSVLTAYAAGSHTHVAGQWDYDINDTSLVAYCSDEACPGEKLTLVTPRNNGSSIFFYTEGVAVHASFDADQQAAWLAAGLGLPNIVYRCVNEKGKLTGDLAPNEGAAPSTLGRFVASATLGGYTIYSGAFQIKKSTFNGIKEADLSLGRYKDDETSYALPSIPAGAQFRFDSIDAPSFLACTVDGSTVSIKVKETRPEGKVDVVIPVTEGNLYEAYDFKLHVTLASHTHSSTATAIDDTVYIYCGEELGKAGCDYNGKENAMRIVLTANDVYYGQPLDVSYQKSDNWDDDLSDGYTIANIAYAKANSSRYSVTTPKDAGAYTARLAVQRPNGNYCYAYAEFTIKKADSTFSKAPVAAEVDYNGAPQDLVKEPGESSDGTVVYALDPDGPFSKDFPQGTDAGEYPVYYKVAGDDNHEDSSVETITAKINKIAPTKDDVDVTLPENPVYDDGKDKTPTVEPKKDVDGLGDLTTIVTKRPDDAPDTKPDTYPGKDAVVTDPTDPGTYDVWVAVDEGKNYTKVDPENPLWVDTFTIAKADMDAPAPSFGDIMAYPGNTAEVELPELPKGASYKDEAFVDGTNPGLSFKVTEKDGKPVLVATVTGPKALTEVPVSVKVPVDGGKYYNDSVAPVTLRPVLHVHEYTYKAVDNQLKIFCTSEKGNSDCDHYGEANAVVLTLNADDSTYNGAAHPAAIAPFADTDPVAGEWGALTGKMPSQMVITYTDENGVASTTAPVKAGKYTASISVEKDGVTYTAEKAFTIAKAVPTVTAPTPATDLVYKTATPQELLTAPATTDGGKVQYSLSPDKDFQDKFPTGVNAGTYPVYYKVVGDENYEDVPAQPVNATISKKNPGIEDLDPTVPSDPIPWDEQNPTKPEAEKKDPTLGDIIITYSPRDPGEKQHPDAPTSPTTTEYPTKPGVYDIWAEVDDNSPNFNPTEPNEPIWIGELVIDKATYEDNSNTNGKILGYQNNFTNVELPALPDGAEYPTGNVNVETDLLGVVTAYVKNDNLTVVAMENLPKDLPTGQFIVTVPVKGGDLYKDFDVLVAIVPYFHDHSFVYDTNANDNVIKYYCVATEGVSQDPTVCKHNGEDNAATLTVNTPAAPIPYDGNAHEAELVLASDWEALTGIKAEDVTVLYNGSTALPVKAGKYDVTVKAGNEIAVAVLTIAKVDPTVSTAEPIRTTYDADEHELLEKPVEADPGCTVLYSLDKNGPFTPDVPKATDAGTYPVYYKVVGDENKNDVPVQSVDAVIEKKDPTIDDLTYTVPTQEIPWNAVNPEQPTADKKDPTMGDLTIDTPSFPAEPGEYPVKVAVADGKNFNATPDDQPIVIGTIKIGKADVDDDKKSVEGKVLGYKGGSAEIELPTLPDGAALNSSNLSLDDPDLPVAPYIWKHVLNIGVKADLADAPFVVSVPVNGGKYYNDYEIKATVTPYFHDHDFVYVSTGDTLEYFCQNTENAEEADCPYNVDNKATVALEAPNAPYTYDGKPHGVNVVPNANWTPAVGSTPAAVYEGTDSTGAPYGPTYEAPCDAGTYTATITAGGETATKPFEIKKAKAAVDGANAPAAAADLTYNGQDQDLVIPGSSPDGTVVYGPAENGPFDDAIPTGKDADTYPVYYKVKGDKNHEDSEPVALNVPIAPKAATVSADNKSKIYLDADPKLTYSTEGLIAGETLTDVSVTRKAGKTHGTYPITLTVNAASNSNYALTVKNGTFTINKRDISKSKVTLSATSYYFDRKAKKPGATVVDAAYTLANKTDYTVAYANNTEVGTATTTITGTGSCYGTVKKTFKIVEDSVRDLNELNKGIYTHTSGSKNVVKWGIVTYADGYDIYSAECGVKYANKPNATVTGSKTLSVTLTKIAGKKINDKKSYKSIVKAYRMVNGKKVYVATSYEVHSGGTKYSMTNASSVKVDKTSVSLKVGKTATVKGTLVLQNKKKKVLDHIDVIRYWSYNPTIATIDAKGKITAKAKGTATIYVMAENGQKTAVKVTVK